MATRDGYDASAPFNTIPGTGASARDVTENGYSAFLSNPSFLYYLAMYDNTLVRHYWTDSLPQTANAPAGPTYLTATLTVLLRIQNPGS